jgi:hypothetical protein
MRVEHKDSRRGGIAGESEHVAAHALAALGESRATVKLWHVIRARRSVRAREPMNQDGPPPESEGRATSRCLPIRRASQWVVGCGAVIAPLSRPMVGAVPRRGARRW